MKRWLKLSLDASLPVMFSPGAIGILRHVSASFNYSEFADGISSYKNHDMNEPGFYLGMALPLEK